MTLSTPTKGLDDKDFDGEAASVCSKTQAIFGDVATSRSRPPYCIAGVVSTTMATPSAVLERLRRCSLTK